MEQDQAVAAAIQMCSESKGCSFTPDNKSYELFFRIADETAEAQLKQADQGDGQPTEGLRGKTDEFAGSPLIDGQKQTNILLGQLIAEIQGLRATITGSDIQKIAPPAEEDAEEEESKAAEDTEAEEVEQEEKSADAEDDDQVDEDAQKHIRLRQSRLDNVRQQIENHIQKLNTLEPYVQGQ